jgi:4-hydroxy-3-methylbut-2-enyl diphosphate reductase
MILLLFTEGGKSKGTGFIVKIRLAKTAGFCMGVQRAVEIVLDVANSRTPPIYTFGPLIHNPQVLEILKQKGVSVVTDPSQVPPGHIVIRAHGIMPQTKEALEKAGFAVIDATCPRVIKVQTIISKYADRGYGVIIVGDENHPEVVGLVGFSGGKGHVIREPEEISRLPDFKDVIIVAQTTQDETLFEAIVRAARARFPRLQVFNTICYSTRERQGEARKMAGKVDAVLVVGGRDSGNTQRLAQVVEQEGVRAFHVESEADLDNETLNDLRAVGITAGASTPNWVIKKVYQRLENRTDARKGWAAQAIRRLQRWLLLSNLYLAVGAGCLSYTCALLSGLEPSLPAAVMATCYVLSMHILNNFIGREAVRYNDPDRAAFYEHYQWMLIFLAITSGTTGLVMAFLLGPVPFALLGVISILGLLYKVRLVPDWIKGIVPVRKISDIPGSKTVLIALAWGIVTAALPHLSQGSALGTPTIFVTFLATVIAFVRTAFFDILDIQGNRLVGQESLPIILGEKKALALLKQLLVFSMAACLFAPIMALASTLAYGLVFSLLYLGWSIQAFQKHWILPGSKFEFLVETVFPFTAAVSLVWQLM